MHRPATTPSWASRRATSIPLRSPGLAHLGHGAAHVEVDEVGAGGGDALGGGLHDVGVRAEQLHRDRVLVGVDAQQLGAGALVAVVHGVAGDHLGDHQARAVTLGLQPHEPVADPGQRGQHHAVGDGNPAEGPAVGERGAHGAAGSVQKLGHLPLMVRMRDMDITSLIRPWAELMMQQVPGLEFFDAHTHLGQNDPDGMKQTPAELLDTLGSARARGAFVFPMHEPNGYRTANDMVIDAASQADGLLTPFCRVNPNNGDARAEVERALEAGAKGIKLHPRAEQFTLDHPAVRELAALAHERELPILIHAGRGIPALGIHAVELAAAFPGTRFILAHAGVCDLSWIWRVAADHPNLMFDTAWWMPADLQALFALVPPGQILFASDAPYGHTLMSAIFQLRSAVQVGLSPEQIRSITFEQSLRIAAG